MLGCFRRIWFWAFGVYQLHSALIYIPKSENYKLRYLFYSINFSPLFYQCFSFFADYDKLRTIFFGKRLKRRWKNLEVYSNFEEFDKISTVFNHLAN